MIRLEDLGDELKARFAEFGQELIKRVQPIAGAAFLAEYKVRIFERGEAIDGSKIGSYSTQPAYFPKKAFVNQGAFRAQGKNGARKEAKSMYLPAGYKQLRQVQGKETGTKNLQYSNSLFVSVQQYEEGEKILIAIASIKESLKRKGQEKQANKVIFAASEKEKIIYRDSIIEEAVILIEQIFK